MVDSIASSMTSELLNRASISHGCLQSLILAQRANVFAFLKPLYAALCAEFMQRGALQILQQRHLPQGNGFVRITMRLPSSEAESLSAWRDDFRAALFYCIRWLRGCNMGHFAKLLLNKSRLSEDGVSILVET